PPSARRHETRELTVVPGFIDVHIHGAAGYDVMDTLPGALAAIAASAAAHGTTSFLATTVTASEELTSRAAETVAAWMELAGREGTGGTPSAEILGLHVEGP